MTSRIRGLLRCSLLLVVLFYFPERVSSYVYRSHGTYPLTVISHHIEHNPKHQMVDLDPFEPSQLYHMMDPHHLEDNARNYEIMGIQVASAASNPYERQENRALPIWLVCEIISNLNSHERS
ncbi:hypothetical protein RF11_04430 [Thelohanellus kitauei]|uniref:Uncharacterized protein n=1 Tax=Thelohanellus kitauei TaxID=669202 RepID=A0A0C2IU94_THEKT|nr:hypothetical protein RF11_04430 [Thelohanellus kitauei]